ncbi:MAG: PA14 domain-containing protein [Planctomycetota bacterium]|nr:PA14 domain-containing protein [Planctomycetota bacterium]
MRLVSVLLIIAFLFTAVSANLRATWYGENVEDGADIMFMDVCWPWWPESTYFANWNFGTNPTGIGGYGGFTGGIQSLGPDHRPNYGPEIQAAWRPGSVWSFWGGNKEGEPVRVVASSEYAYPRQYIGEGASGSLGGSCWPFIKQGQWYTMLMRVWEPVDVTNPQYSYIGRWVKDVSTGQWHLYGIMRLPVPASSFRGNAGFLEDCGNAGRSVRSMYRRLGYYRKAGQWRSSNVVSYNENKKGQLDNYWVVQVKPEGDHEILAMELSANPKLLPQKLFGTPLEFGRKHEFRAKQPEQPTLDKPKVASVTAESNGRQVLVSWEIPADSSPQFLYRVEVFGNAACQGEPVVVRQERMPTVRMVLLDAVVANPTVRFSLTDVFDQTIAPMVVTAKASANPWTATADTVAPGLSYELLHQDKVRHENFFFPPCAKLEQSKREEHHWLSLNELGTGRAVQQGISRGFDTSLAGTRRAGYAFRFKGFLRVPATGLYVLRMQGADGYRITIDGHEALTWDGPHGPAERSAAVHVAEGHHALEVEYFVDKPDVPFFRLEWEGPGLPRQEIPSSALLHKDTGQIPVAALTTSGGNDGTASLKVVVDPRGHTTNKTRLFLGKMQIAESNGPSLTYDGPMLDGVNNLWTRIVYDTKCTVDSEPTTLAVHGPEVKNGWALTVAGEAKAVRGVWQTAPDAFSFMGEGEYVITRRVAGDFTLTCRIDSFAGSRGEPVNGSSWAGLTAREHGDRNNRAWGEEFGVFQMAHHGLRTTPDFSDLGDGRCNDYELPKGHPWVRMVRRRQVWTAWSSADGKNWQLGATHLKPMAASMDAGVIFRALPQDAQAYFHAKVSSVTLEAGVAKDVVIPVPVAATHTDGSRLTGVVMARSDAKVVVVRSSERGLFRSTDDGKTWLAANGNLSGAANVVRSIAIHPKDSQIMFRAAGRAADSAAWDGGLWKTTSLAPTRRCRSWDAANLPCRQR